MSVDDTVQREETAGPFQWNLGGWFGGQVGSTLWLLILGVLLFSRDALAAGVALAAFVTPNLVGWVMWESRERLDPYRSIQFLIALVGFCALLTTVVLDLRGVDELPGTGDLGTGSLYWVLLVFPFLLVLLHLQARGMRRRSPGPDA